MDKEGEKSSKSPHFFRVILPCTLQEGVLELPSVFVKNYGEHLSKDVLLKLPTGEESKIELKRSEDQIWLHKGWQDFVDKYSIKGGYFVVFKYIGESRFNVFIFDLTCTMVRYPVTSARANAKNTAEKSKAIQVKQEDTEDGECPQEVHKGKEIQKPKKARKLRTGQTSYSVKNMSIVSDPVIEGRELGTMSASVRAVQRAKQSKNLHAIVEMKQAYVSENPYMYLRASPLKDYLCKMGSKMIHIDVIGDGRGWTMEYSAQPYLRISKGWTKFVRGNDLQKGDVCFFELVNKRTMTFEVTIFRDTDQGVDQNGPLMMANNASAPQTTKTEVNHVASTAVGRALKFNSKNPYFRINITRYHLSCKGKVYLPLAHSGKYIKEHKPGTDNFIILHRSDGQTWPVRCILSGKKMKAYLIKGWRKFASDNNLHLGDICIFEMMNEKSDAYKVTIIRASGRE